MKILRALFPAATVLLSGMFSPVGAATFQIQDVSPVAAVRETSPPAMTANFTITSPGTTPDWTASLEGNPAWASLSVASGTGPGSLNINFNTAALTAGTYSTALVLDSGGTISRQDFTLTVITPNVLKMEADYRRPVIYALHRSSQTPAPGYVIFLNTTTEQVELVLPAGPEAPDMDLSHPEDRLYVSNHLAASNSVRVIDLAARREVRAMNAGADVYKINVGASGRMITEGFSQTTAASLLDSMTATAVATTSLREGDGEFDLAGRYYYHCENNIFTARITRYDMQGDTFASGLTSTPRGFGSRNLILTGDGSRFFWQRYAYDTGLNELRTYDGHIHATTFRGEIVFGDNQAYDGNSGAQLSTLPLGASSVMAVSGDQQKLFRFNALNGSFTRVLLSSIRQVPAPGTVVQPPHDAVVSVPVTRLSWDAVPQAAKYRVYYGMTAAAVAAATMNSQEYAGETMNTYWPLPDGTPAPGTALHWRVDYVGVTTVTPGSVRSFRLLPVSVGTATVEARSIRGAPPLQIRLPVTGAAGATWTASTSGAAWLRVVTPSGGTGGMLELEITPGALAAGTYNDALVLAAGGLSAGVPVSLTVEAPGYVALAADPLRPRLYALQRAATLAGSVAVINTSTSAIERVIPLSTNPDDLDLTPDGQFLYIVTRGGRKMHRINLTDWSMEALGLADTVDDNHASVRYRVTAGGGTTVYWVDGAAFAKLHAMDFSTGEETGPSILALSGDGFGDIAWTNSGTRLAGWNQRSWSSGSTSTSTVLVEGNNPLAIIGTNWIPITGGETQLPVMARHDGSAVFMAKYKLTADLNTILSEYPAEVFAVTKDSGIVFGAKEAWRERSLTRVWQAPANVDAKISTVAGDQSAYFYFDQTAGALVRVAMSSIGDVPGPSPEDGEVVSAMPVALSWTPNPQALRYEVYFGTDEAGVAAAAGSGSPYYLGSAAAAMLPPGVPFQTGGLWWWRVDTVLPGSTIKGPVWRFSGALKYLNALSGATSHSDNTVPPLAMDGTVMMSGYPEFTVDSTNFPGVVYVHRKRPGSEEWYLHQKIFKPATAAASARFGSAVAIKGDIAWIGARLGTTGGRAYEYRMDSVTGLWTSTGRSITPPVPASIDQFGSTIAFDGSVLAVGAPGATVSNQTQAGAVDVFDAASLTRMVRATEATPSSSVKFGTIMAMGDGFLAVANPDRVTTVSGAVDIWTRSGTTWTRTATLTEPAGSFGSDFGTALAVSGDRLFVGTAGQVDITGKVFVYQRGTGTTWNPVAQFEAAGPFRTDAYGSSLAAEESVLVMGTPSINTTQGLTKSPVWLHRNAAGQTWLPVAPAEPDNLRSYSRFASNVVVTDRYLAAAYNGGPPGGVTVFLHNAAGNLPPRFTSAPLLFAEEGTTYSYRLSAADENPGDQITFTAQTALPAWLHLADSGDGRTTLTGTPHGGSAGDFSISVVATDESSDTARQQFTLKVVPAGNIPRITSTSGDQTSDDASPVELTVTVAAGGTTTYQWYHNGILLSSQTGPKLTFNSVQASDAGSYRVRVSRNGVSVDSDPMLLTVNQLPDRFGGDWPTLGAGPSHSGAYPATLSRHKFLPAWTLPNAGTNEVVTGDGRVYMTGYVFPSPTARVAAYDLQSGSRLWATSIPSGYSINPPTFHRGRVYMQRGEFGGPTSADGPDLRCFDAASGTSQWTARLADQANFYYAPAIDDTGIYVNGGGGGGIYGFGFDGSQTFFEDLEQFSQWTPMLHQGRVYSWVSTSFRRHDPLSGQVLSTVTLPGGLPGGGMGTVAAAEGNTAVMFTPAELVAIDLAAERVLWKHRKSFLGSPAISKGIVYAIRDGGVESFDALTGVPGRIYETRDASNQNVTGIHQPVVLDDTLFVASNDSIWTFDLATGALLQRLSGGGRLTYTGGVLLAAGSDSDRTLRTWKVNQPAIVTPPAPALAATEDIAFSWDIAATDPDSDTLSVSITGLPAWLTAAPLQQGVVRLTGTPLNEHAGTFSFTINVNDSKSFPASLTIDGSVLAVNDNPLAAALAPVIADEDATIPPLPLPSVFSDEEDGFPGLTVVIMENSNPDLFSSAVLSGGQLHMRLAPDAFGAAVLKLTATDSGGLSVDAVVSVTVNSIADAPRPAVNPPAPDIPVDGSGFSYAAAALFTDPDPGEVLGYSIVSVDRPELFRVLSVDAGTGLLSVAWTPYVWGAAIVTLRAAGRDGLALDTPINLSLAESPAPQWSLAGAATWNRQTGLAEQTVRVKNTGGRAIAGFELWLTTGNGTALYNGISAASLGIPNPAAPWMLPYSVPLDAGQEITLVLEFHSANRQATFQIAGDNPIDPLVPPHPLPPATGAPFGVTRALAVTGGILIEFASEPGASYRIEYSADNSLWAVCPIPLRAGGTRVQWIDRGPPFTNSAPNAVPARFYRVRRL